MLSDKEYRQQVTTILKEDLEKGRGPIVIRRIWQNGQNWWVSYVMEFEAVKETTFGVKATLLKASYDRGYVSDLRKKKFGPIAKS